MGIGKVAVHDITKVLHLLLHDEMIPVEPNVDVNVFFSLFFNIVLPPNNSIQCHLFVQVVDLVDATHHLVLHYAVARLQLLFLLLKFYSEANVVSSQNRPIRVQLWHPRKPVTFIEVCFEGSQRIKFSLHFWLYFFNSFNFDPRVGYSVDSHTVLAILGLLISFITNRHKVTAIVTSACVLCQLFLLLVWGLNHFSKVIVSFIWDSYNLVPSFSPTIIIYLCISLHSSIFAFVVLSYWAFTSLVIILVSVLVLSYGRNFISSDCRRTFLCFFNCGWCVVCGSVGFKVKWHFLAINNPSVSFYLVIVVGIENVSHVGCYVLLGGFLLNTRSR